MSILDRFHGGFHVGEIVERVEYAKNIHAAFGGVFDETGDDVCGIAGVADCVCASEEHLKTDVGNALAEDAESLPRVLVEKAHGGVEGGTAPHFE